MPVLFVGHGSPMNAIEDNEFSRGWREIAGLVGKPRAILCVSAHWFVKESLVLAAKHPRTIHDFYGFPRDLYDVRYPAPGAPELAEQVSQIVASESVAPDDSWGLDHGCWAVLRSMYPQADIPVCQLSLNFTLPSEAHYQIGRELAGLRDEGVLIVGSGNIVHNLGMVDWRDQGAGYPWADEFDALCRNSIKARDDERLVRYEGLGRPALLSIPTPDHYWPLLYVLGASASTEPVRFFNERRVLGSVSMTCVLIG